MDIKEKEHQITTKEFRARIIDMEAIMKNFPDSATGDAIDKICPLKHSYADGIYIRQIFMPKGIIVISKIHKFMHPYFVLQGKASVLTETGVELIKAPYQGITKAGTKRALLIHEDMIWITVHKTDKTDLKDIEEEIIAKDFASLDDFLNMDIIDAKIITDKEEVEQCLTQQ